MIDGDLREIVHTRDAERLRDYCYDGPDPEGALAYITHLGIDWIAPACTWWSGYRGMPDWNSLQCIDEEVWQVSVAGIVVAGQDTFDIQRAQHLWSIVPGWMTLPEWWAWAEGALERGFITKAQYDAPINALLAKWRWCHGKVSDEGLDAARAAALDAALDAAWAAERTAASAAWAARAAASAAWAARAAARAAWAARAAARAALRAALRDAASDAARAAARDASYKRYCDLFTEYVWLEVMKQRTA